MKGSHARNRLRVSKLEERVDRVRKMEQYFDAILDAKRSWPETLLSDPVIRMYLQELQVYYEHGQWLNDYECDERGELPADLKRGVLSQDALYDLFSEMEDLADEAAGKKEMNIKELCDAIKLQTVIKKQVIEFSETFDFHLVDALLMRFREYRDMNAARMELKQVLGEDPGNVKMLACMLKASADLYDVYREKGICDEVFIETMKCYTRFIDETHQMTGRWEFDRDWWTTRQAGGHLFRIGELEYEIKALDDRNVIEMHIPSDAKFSPEYVDESLKMAREFWREFFPKLLACEYRCESWLMDRQLLGMLDEDSNILSFQKRFEIFDEGEASSEFVEWLFQTKTTDYETLSENTSLQRKVKAHVLSGGVIRNAYGKLREA